MIKKVSDIYYYIQGNYRYKIYYSKSKLIGRLMRTHIREQIDYRIIIMNAECYTLGYCVNCGCKTTALQMANKPCEGMEYPPMTGKNTWHYFKDKTTPIKWKEYMWIYYNDGKNKETKLFKETHNLYVSIETPIRKS